jgi:hypothetical protein
MSGDTASPSGVDSVEHQSARRRHKTRSDSRRVVKVITAIEAHHDRIESEVARNISTDHELLTKIDALLAPETGPKSGLVDAVRTLCDDAF